MPALINAIYSVPGTGNQVAGTSGLTLPKGTTGERSDLVATIRFNTSTSVFEATPDGISYVTFASATGPIVSISGTADRISITSGANPTVDISTSYAGQSSITTLGTISTGTWEADPIDVVYGGTGLSSTTANQLLYSSSDNVISGLATVNSGVVITSSGGVPSVSDTLPSGITLVAPVLGTPASGTLTNCTGYPAGSISGIVGVTHGGTGLSSITSGKLIYASAADTFSELSLGQGLAISTGTLAVGVSNNIPFSNNKGIIDGNGENMLLFLTGVSVANYSQMTNSSAGSGPLLQAFGSDTDIFYSVSGKGASGVKLCVNQGSNQVANFSGPTSSTNYFSFISSTASDPVSVSAAGPGSNIGYNISSKGLGSVTLYSHEGSNVIATFEGPASSVDYFTFVPGGGSNPGRIMFGAEGAHDDINFAVTSKGIGNFEIFSGVGNYPVASFHGIDSAVNFLQVLPGVTGSAVILSVGGGDTDADLGVEPRGSGLVQIRGFNSFASTGSNNGVIGTTLPDGYSSTVTKWLRLADNTGAAVLIPCFSISP